MGEDCALRFVPPGRGPREHQRLPRFPLSPPSTQLRPACPHLTPILPLQYFSMIRARRTLPNREGAGVISTRFISSFRLPGAQPCAPLGRAPGARVPLLFCLNKQSCVPGCAKRVCSPAASLLTRRQEWKPKLSRNEGDDANLETDPAPGNDAPAPPPRRAASQSGMNGCSRIA